jgi:GDP-4-dehydro-6-deoxy-D-mannose reductase
VRVVVTGNRGFVGRWLTEHLESQGDEVFGFDTEVDITDPSAFREAVTAVGPEAVYHLAALASVAASFAGSTHSTYLVNTVGTANVIDAALACSPRPRVLLVSSSEVYGRVVPDDLPLTEEQRIAPVSPYAASKAAAEMIGLQAWLGPGLEVVRARPFNHTGPGQRGDFVVPALAQQVVAAASSGARSLVTGNLEARRDLTDVRDVVRAYRQLVVSGVPGEVYNVCSGRAVSIRSVAERLMAVAGLDLSIEVDPARLRPSEIPELRGDAGRLHRLSGWEPAIDLDRTLADVLEECRSGG